MSAIPPNLVGPILQSPLAQGQASAARENEDAQRASSERRQNGAISEADSTIETSEDDTQVFTDAQGAGSQGRAFSSPEEKQKDEELSWVPEEPGDEHQIDVEA